MAREVTFRPEFQPPWTGQPQVTMLTLNRLDLRERTALVAQFAGGRALPGEVVEQITDRYGERNQRGKMGPDCASRNQYQ
jgi:predicted ATPase